MKFIDKYYAEDKFRSNPCGKWCPYQLGYEEAPKEKYKCPETVKSYSCDACWDREMPEEIKTTESKSEPANANGFPGFEINDVVQLRNGNLYIILPNNNSKDNKSLVYTYAINESHFGSGLRCLHYCCDYTDNSHENNRLHDVVKLWRSTPKDALVVVGNFFNKGKISESVKPIWIEQPKKKMTLKEIEKELGYPVEIVPESESEGNES